MADGVDGYLLDGSRSILAGLQGALDVSGPSVTAVMEGFGTCFESADRVRFTGTLTNHILQMTSAPIGQTTIDVSGTMASDNRSFAGSYAVRGGCGDGSTGPMKGRRLMLGGIWVSSGWTIDGSPVSVEIDMRVAETPDDRGSFQLSGRIHATWSACLTEATLQGWARGRVLFPDFATPDGQTVVAELLAEANDDDTEMQTVGVFTSGPCVGRSFGGLFTRR